MEVKLKSSSMIGTRPTVWYAGTERVIGPYGSALHAADTYARGIVGILEMVLALSAGAPEITVLVCHRVARAIGLANSRERFRITDGAQAVGYKHGNVGPWTIFHASGRPTVYVGQIQALHDMQGEDLAYFPFDSTKPADTLAAMQLWHQLTGVAWQAGSPVMGLETMHRTLPRYHATRDSRRPLAKPAKTDPEGTPHGARESMWTTRAWARPPRDVARQLGATGGSFWIHGYDKVRAGFTAAGIARLSPARLEHRHGGRYDRERAGWYSIPSPAWNEKVLPHPAGPDALNFGARLWVTNATMDLLDDVARQGRIAMPEIIESWTGPARTVLEPWYALLMDAYRAQVPDRYAEADHAKVRAAVRRIGKAGIGMLNNPESTIYRRDWFHTINATKRANAWRRMDRIGRTEGRYPCVIDDDCLYYPSLNPDPREAAPAAFKFTDPDFDPDAGSAYRLHTSREVKI